MKCWTGTHPPGAETTQSYRWRLVGRAEIEAFRAFLYARNGRQRAIWIPTWTHDVVVKATIGISGTALDVESEGFAIYVQAQAHRRDLRIQLADGRIFYRRITDMVRVDETTERLILDASFGEVLDPEDFAFVSFMALNRLDQDLVEIAWNTGSQADSTATFRAVNNDV